MSQLKNYIPVRIDGSIDKLIVSWMDASVLSFRDPMLTHSVVKYKKQNQEFKFITTGTESLLAAAKEGRPIPPSGFIFHVSRCGSTLLSNALQQLERNIVVSEAGIINSLLEYYVLSNNSNQREYISELLRGVLNIYGIKRMPEQSNLFIKFSSWNVILIDLIKDIWPTTPAVFAFRDPFEVLDSILVKHAGWVRFYQNQDISSKLIGSKGDESFIEFLIEFLSKMYQPGLIQHNNITFINYASHKILNIKKVLAHFHLEPSFLEWEKIRQVSNINSKDRQQNEFKAIKQKQFKLTQQVTEMVEKKLIPLYQQLDSSSRQ